MFGALKLGTIVLVAAAAALAAGCGPSREQTLAERGEAIERYCVDCHDDIERTAELSLESQSLTAVAANPKLWEKVVRKLRSGMMPPPDAQGARPEPTERDALASWLEAELDAAATAAPNPGRTEPFHRLNRTEYRNAVRDLLAVDVDVAELLPADDASYGFDNIAGVLKLSPTLLERYLNAADKVSRLAVGVPSEFASIDYFRIPDDRAQDRRLPGMPFGTRGGTSISYTFPADAEYLISAELSRDLNESMPLYAEEQQLEISIDGERVGLFTLPAVPRAPAPDAIATSETQEPTISQIVDRLKLSRAERQLRNVADANWNARVPVTAGKHDVVVTFIAKTAALDETARLPFQRPYPAGVNIPETRTGAYLRSVEISGPYSPTGAGNTASRERIFSCRPAEHGAAHADERCATEILSTLARRAYRRTVTAADLEPLLAFYREGVGSGFDEGVQLALKRLLVSPEFLFRVEHAPAGLAPGAAYALGDFALASRLSFFLWSSIPDDELLAAAEHGKLRDATELDRQVRRMLADPRAATFIESFAGQWLYLRNLEAVVPVQSRFPDFDDTLREGLHRETELFFASIVRDDRSALELLTADYTFVNERVAHHYGIPGIKGSHFRRITLGPDNPRRGLLGQGAILAVTSYPDRTSPVVRGKWILENLLGSAPPPPPPDVPELKSTDGAGETLSMRDRLAAHRANPACAGCHAMMDPLGFALENFDATGRWRTLGDAGEAIDASGKMPDGTAFDGVAEFRAALLSDDRFVATLTEKLLTYALGRGVEYYDQPAVRAIVRDAAADDYRFSSLVAGVVRSAPFRMRKSE
jgi:uncharacterized protein DUF1592/uncharacterized protein DUF1588/uncharacterized protein DUF1587/uncharacterized protein DUF1585/uncharacterized protein DUF1595/cytochrome c